MSKKNHALCVLSFYQLEGAQGTTWRLHHGPHEFILGHRHRSEHPTPLWMIDLSYLVTQEFYARQLDAGFQEIIRCFDDAWYNNCKGNPLLDMEKMQETYQKSLQFVGEKRIPRYPFKNKDFELFIFASSKKEARKMPKRLGHFANEYNEILETMYDFLERECE